MAEDITKRGIREVLEELFKGRDAAIEKYAKVRHTLYEMELWYKYRKDGYSLRDVPKSVKVYFSQRFLKGEKIDDRTPEAEAKLSEGFKRLGHAVDDGCKGRCERLVEELNLQLEELGLRTIKEPTSFLDWLTFDYDVRLDHEGNPVLEKPFGFEIRLFKDERNRKEFWGEIQLLLYTYGKMKSMQDICKDVLDKRQTSIYIKGL